MVTSIRGGKSSEARRIVKVIDSRRAVERVERALTSDRAVISNESRKRWSQQRRAMARQNRSSRRGRDFEVQKRGLGKTFRVWPGRRKIQAEASVVAGVRQHIAQGGQVSGQVKFEYPIQVGGQPQQVEGVLRFEADVESGRPVVTIPLDENVAFSGGLKSVYRVPDSTEVNLLSQVAANEDHKEPGIANSNSPKTLGNSDSSAQNTRPGTERSSNPTRGLRTSKFLRRFALQSYSVYAVNDNTSRPKRRFFAVI